MPEAGRPLGRRFGGVSFAGVRVIRPLLQ